MCVFDLCCTNTRPLLSAVPSEPPQNVRAISVTSDEAVITWAEPPRLTLHGVLKGYRVVFWSLFPDGGGCCGGQAQWPMQSNYHLSHSKLHQPNLPPTYFYVCVVSQNVSVCVLTSLIKHFLWSFKLSMFALVYLCLLWLNQINSDLKIVVKALTFSQL